ncbi:hypothetical protein ABK040_016698 [Willaertia magna]
MFKKFLLLLFLSFFILHVSANTIEENNRGFNLLSNDCKVLYLSYENFLQQLGLLTRSNTDVFISRTTSERIAIHLVESFKEKCDKDLIELATQGLNSTKIICSLIEGNSGSSFSSEPKRWFLNLILKVYEPNLSDRILQSVISDVNQSIRSLLRLEIWSQHVIYPIFIVSISILVIISSRFVKKFVLGSDESELIRYGEESTIEKYHILLMIILTSIQFVIPYLLTPNFNYLTYWITWIVGIIALVFGSTSFYFENIINSPYYNLFYTFLGLWISYYSNQSVLCLFLTIWITLDHLAYDKTKIPFLFGLLTSVIFMWIGNDWLTQTFIIFWILSRFYVGENDSIEFLDNEEYLSSRRNLVWNCLFFNILSFIILPLSFPYIILFRQLSLLSIFAIVIIILREADTIDHVWKSKVE